MNTKVLLIAILAVVGMARPPLMPDRVWRLLCWLGAAEVAVWAFHPRFSTHVALGLLVALVVGFAFFLESLHEVVPANHWLPMPKEPKWRDRQAELGEAQRTHIEALERERHGYVVHGLRDRVKEVDKQINVALDNWWGDQASSEQDMPRKPVGMGDEAFLASLPATQNAARQLIQDSLAELIKAGEALYDARVDQDNDEHYNRWIKTHAMWRSRLGTDLSQADQIAAVDFTGLNEPEQDFPTDLRPARLRVDRIVGNLRKLYDEYHRGER